MLLSCPPGRPVVGRFRREELEREAVQGACSLLKGRSFEPQYSAPVGMTLAVDYAAYLLNRPANENAKPDYNSDFDIERLMKDHGEYVLQEIMRKVFVTIAEQEIEETLPDGKKKYDKRSRLKPEGPFPAVGGSETAYKCAHYVHITATSSGIHNPTQSDLKGYKNL